jgi:hypothetical protein
MTKSRLTLLQELQASVRSGGEGGKTSAEDLRRFLTSVVDELRDLTEDQLGAIYSAQNANALNAFVTQSQLVETNNVSIGTAVGSAPPIVVHAFDGLTSFNYTDLGQALFWSQASGNGVSHGGYGGMGGYTLTNRPTTLGGQAQIGINGVLDLQNKPLNLNGNYLHLYSNSMIINNSLIYNGIVYIRPGAVTPSIQGGTIAARIQISQDPSCKVILDNVLVTDYGYPKYSSAFQSVGSGTLVMRNGSKIINTTLDPATIVTTEISTLEALRTTVISSDAKSADYTLAATDAGQIVPFTASALCTIPPNVFPVNTVIEVCQEGAGKVSIVAGAGVSLYFADGAKTAKQWASVSLHQRSLNKWVITGGVA